MPSIYLSSQAIYDYKRALLPHLATDIHFYGIPHVFKITKHCGKACMQYKMYSDSLEYLPVMPTVQFEAISNESIKAHLEDSFVFVGGKTRYYASCNVVGDASSLDGERLEKIKR
jgi:hypothetical protein